MTKNEEEKLGSHGDSPKNMKTKSAPCIADGDKNVNRGAV